MDGDYNFGDFPVMHNVEGGTWRVLEGKKTEENSAGKNENESWLSKQVYLSTLHEAISCQFLGWKQLHCVKNLLQLQCHEECSYDEGCSGPRAEDCISCKHVRLSKRG